jgi:hypothetical protein
MEMVQIYPLPNLRPALLLRLVEAQLLAPRYYLPGTPR